MQFRVLNLIVFFLGVLLVAYLVMPRDFDMVAMYRNSYLYNQALVLLDRLEEQRPEDARIDLERARVLFLAGRYEEGIALMQRLTQREPENTSAWRQAAAFYRVTQHPRDAMVAFENLLVHAPADSEALYILDEYYRWFQMPDNAIANLQAMTRHYPQDRYTREKLFDLYMRTRNPEGGIATLNGIISQFSNTLGEQQELGRLYLVQGDPQAVGVFQTLYAQFPDSSGVAQDLIEALRATGQSAEAVAVYRSHHRPRLDDEAFFDGLVDLYVSLDDPLNAARTLDEKLAALPSVDTRYAAALMYRDAGHYRDALGHTRVLVAEQAEQRDFWYTHFELLGALEAKVELATALEAYLTRWSDDWRRWSELADTYNWMEAYDREVQILTRLARQFPEQEDYACRLAEGLAARGRYAQAARIAADLVKRHPRNAVYRDLLVQVVQALPPGAERLGYARLLVGVVGRLPRTSALALAELYEQAGHVAQANRIYDGLLRQFPADAALRVKIGRLTWFHSRPENARIHLRHALKLAPADTAALVTLSDVLRDDSPQEALGYLNRLDDIAPEEPETIYRLGAVHESLQDTTRSNGFYRRYVMLNQNSNRTDVFFFRQKAHALYRTGADDRALVVLTEGTRRYPNDLEMINDYAEVLIYQKRYDQALAILERIELLRGSEGTDGS